MKEHLTMSTAGTPSAAESGTFTLGGDLTVRRLGFGTMRLTGPGIWGPPPDRSEALSVLRRAVALGVTLIDTADSYGPAVSEELIAEALFPYPAGVAIATKGGYARPGPDHWVPDGRPEHLRAALEGSLKRLRLERIDLYQLHTPDPNVPFADSVGTLVELQRAGKIRHIGLSNVTTAQLAHGRQIASIVSVQNRFNLSDRASQDVLEVCTRDGLGFLPWFPLATGALARGGGPLDQLARRHQASAAQVALAWLLQRSAVLLPIPGTATVRHLEEDIAAASLRLTPEEMEQLNAASGR
jgi:aryl-alcohol dehydrogenase-like predicted oxidoreductase